MFESDDLEFIEIHNPTGRPVDMTEWRIRGGVDINFDDGAILESQQTWIVLSFNPDNPDNAARLSAFNTHYGLTGTETFIGGYGGSLSNSQDRVQLQWPDEPPTNGPDVIPRLFQDEITYDDRAPWPTTADGNGASLQRRAPVFYGNDVLSWRAEPATPGQVDFSGNVNGDFNNDGLANALDIDILTIAARQPSAAIYMDLDGSFSVTQGDVTAYLQTVVGARFGDANLDGVVDGSDFNIWNDNKFQSCNKSWGDGDWSGDGVVDGADFNVWTINRFTSAAPVAAAQVPRLPRAAAAVDAVFAAMTTPELSQQHPAAEAHHVASEPAMSLLTSQEVPTDNFFANRRSRASQNGVARRVRVQPIHEWIGDHTVSIDDAFSEPFGLVRSAK